jgi:hypothetical protein
MKKNSNEFSAEKAMQNVEKQRNVDNKCSKELCRNF